MPKGFAHGYQTLAPDTETFYQVSEYYTPEAEDGVRWDDPAFGIEWPDPANAVLSEKDRNWPDFTRMIVVDRLLERRVRREGRPVRVAMVGAGFMGRGIALQIATATPGMELVAIANRTVDKAREAYALGAAPRTCVTSRARASSSRRSRDGRPPSRTIRCSSPRRSRSTR